jgi:protein-S-isoprenylcysteine O-methyltransferase Ste14
MVQFGLFVLFFLNLHLYVVSVPTWLVYIGLATLVIGILVVLFGILNLNDNLSPFPSPKKNSELIQNGIYKYIRHPIYSGILIAMTGYSVYAGALEKIAITLAMGVVFYFKSAYEEKLLLKRYASYAHYQKLTGRFFPKGPK